jgi:hypothetical protein
MELSPYQYEALRLEREMLEITQREQRAYAPRLNKPAPPKPVIPPKPKPKRRETRGSKPGARRGHYKHRRGPKTKLSTSEYYGTAVAAKKITKVENTC